MSSALISGLAMLRGVVRSRAALHLEVLALRHQLPVLQTVPTAPAAPCQDGPMAVGVAVPLVERLANGTRDREAGNRHRLASQGLPPFLDVEESPEDRATASPD
jgi:hypothetical protein